MSQSGVYTSLVPPPPSDITFTTDQGASGDTVTGTSFDLTAAGNGTPFTFTDNVSVLQLILSDSDSNIILGNNTVTGAPLSGSSNAGLGNGVLYSLTSGAGNVGIGEDAGYDITTGGQNVAIGADCLANSGNFSFNTAIGSGIAATSTFTGSNNVFLGFGVGGGTYTGAESNNILIGQGVTGTVGESNATHIGNIFGTTTGSASAIVTCDSTGLLGTSALTNGQLLIGSTGASPVAANITSTGGTITITNGAGSINIDTTFPEAVTWSNVNASTVALVAGHGYDVTYSSGGVTATLPATAAQYTIIRISVGTSQIVSIAERSGQQIQYGNRITTATSGGLASTAVGDSLELLCTTANTVWRVLSSQGNWTVS